MLIQSTTDTPPMTYDQIDYILPAHWLPALVNEDRSGLNDADDEQITAFCRSEIGGMRREGWRFGHYSHGDGEPSFDPYHDARFVGCLPCNCVPVSLHFYKI